MGDGWRYDMIPLTTLADYRCAEGEVNPFRRAPTFRRHTTWNINPICTYCGGLRGKDVRADDTRGLYFPASGFIERCGVVGGGRVLPVLCFELRYRGGLCWGVLRGVLIDLARPSFDSMVGVYFTLYPDPNPDNDRQGNLSEIYRNEDVMRSWCGLSTFFEVGPSRKSYHEVLFFCGRGGGGEIMGVLWERFRVRRNTLVVGGKAGGCGCCWFTG